MTQAANLAALGSNTNTTGILPAAGGGTAGTAGVTGFKNRIINGAMQISQYYGTSSFTPNSNTYTLDRWQTNLAGSGYYTVQQNAGSVTPPAGFSTYYGVTSSGVNGQGNYTIRQAIEGYNIADLDFGKSTAKTLTLSFWVRSSLTGTFSGAIKNGNFDRSYVFSYTISAANTWQQVTVTFAGDTTGTWATDNTTGMIVWLAMGISSSQATSTTNSWIAGDYRGLTGTTNVMGTSGATFYVTGVQLEVGSTATNFDVRSYGTELSLCQRYAYKFGSSVPYNGGFYTSTQILATIIFPVTMRATPTYTAGTATAFYNGGSTSVTPSQNQQSVNSGLLTLTGATSTAGYSAAIISNNDLFSAEL